MKIVLGVLCVFLMSIAMQSQARELSLKEKTTLLNLDKTIGVKSFMESNMVVQDLPLSQYLTFKVLKNTCRPLTGLIQKINSSEDEFADQSKTLVKLLNICSQGVIGITSLYIEQQH